MPRVEANDKNILEIMKRAKSLEISPREAEKKLGEYLLSDKSVPITEYFRRVGMWEKLSLELAPFHEKYAEKHNLSGKLNNFEACSALCGTTDESFYETPGAKEMTKLLIEMGRENKK
jgi:hypothetical protein